MKVLSFDDVSKLVSRQDAFQAVANALLRLEQGRVLMPEQVALLLPGGGEVHIKGGYELGSQWFAFKVASGGFAGGNNEGFTIAMSAQTGKIVALMADRGWLTEVRTAAAGALATSLMARPDATRVAILGTGVQARHQVEALKALRPISEIFVWGRTPAHAHAFAGEVGGEVCATVEDAVRTADIVYTVTMARSPVLRGEWLAEGTHVTAIGADMVGKRELDEFCLERAHHIACDDVDLSRRVGELQYGGSSSERAVSLGAILANEVVGRCSAKDITVADLCGLGAEDVAMASLVMERIGEWSGAATPRWDREQAGIV